MSHEDGRKRRRLNDSPDASGSDTEGYPWNSENESDQEGFGASGGPSSEVASEAASEAACVEVVRLHTKLEYWRLRFAHEERLMREEARLAAQREREAKAAMQQAQERSRREREERERRERERSRREREEKAREEVPEWRPAEDAQEICTDIRSLEDLVAFAVGLDMGKNYMFDKMRLRRILPALRRLQRLVGQQVLKNEVARQVLCFLQEGKLRGMHHTVIMGPPGAGKSTVAAALADIYHGLGLVESRDGPHTNELTGELSPYPLVVGTRASMVGAYVGHTVARTQAVCDRARGGVLLIDEAYELGQSDTFSQECIDALNRNLSERAHSFICILAGYEKELDEKVFARNPGMARRFPHRYVMEPYQAVDLQQILMLQFEEHGVQCAATPAELAEFFGRNSFPNLGGDMQTLAAHALKHRTRRLFGRAPGPITLQDLQAGREDLHSNQPNNSPPPSMYG